MSAIGNPCPVKGCTAHAKPQQLMCLRHWRRVPKALNHAVFDTYRAMHKGIEEVRAYRQARDAAIAAVEAKEAGEHVSPLVPFRRTDGRWAVGERLFETNEQAWLWLDKQAGEPLSRADDTVDWINRKGLNQ